MNINLQFRISELKKKNLISIITMFDRKIQKWDAAAIKCSPKEIDSARLMTGGYETVYALNTYKYDNSEDAKFELEQKIETIMITIITMSN
jgi:hypothetical protein